MVIRLVFLVISIFIPVFSFAVTNIFFSNNSWDEYEVSSSFLKSDANLTQDKDYHLVQDFKFKPFHPNENVLNFNSNMNIKYHKNYNFSVTVHNKKYPHQYLYFYITTEGQFYGSHITNLAVILPSGRSFIFDPKKISSLMIPEWERTTLHIVPFNINQQGVSWPSYGLVLDQNNPDYFDFSDANTLKLMTYNVQLFPFYADRVNPPNNRSVRAANIPKLVGDQYDFVAFNELFERDLRNHMISEMQKMYPYYVDPVGMNANTFLSSGIVVFSKWPIIATDEHVFTRCSGFDCGASKGVRYTKISKYVNGKEERYNIFATHLQAGSWLIRGQQLLEIREFIQKQNIPSSESVLIAADLNIDSYEKVYFDYSSIAQTYGVLKTEYEFLLQTLNASDPFQTGLKYSADYIINSMLRLSSTSQEKIDYILYLNDYKQPVFATNAVFVIRDLLNPSMYPAFDMSDHLPVVGEFVF